MGRPARIGTSQIVDTAIDVGLDTFSLDEVASHLGVTTPALYSHVAGRDHILRLAAATIITELEPTLTGVDSWEDWLRAWATGIRNQLGAVGEEVLEAVRTSVDAAALRVADHGLRLMIEAGFGPADAGHALWLAVRVACTAGPAGHPSVAAPVARARDVASAAHSPEMADAIDAVTASGGADAWKFDLEVLLAGLQTRIR